VAQRVKRRGESILRTGERRQQTETRRGHRQSGRRVQTEHAPVFPSLVWVVLSAGTQHVGSVRRAVREQARDGGWSRRQGHLFHGANREGRGGWEHTFFQNDEECVDDFVARPYRVELLPWSAGKVAVTFCRLAEARDTEEKTFADRSRRTARTRDAITADGVAGGAGTFQRCCPSIEWRTCTFGTACPTTKYGHDGSKDGGI
jgi:hypothetical protein